MEDTPQGPPDAPPPPAAPPPAAPPPPAPESQPAPGPPQGGAEPNAVMIVLSYLWLLALVPLLVEKDDREVQWHAKHGLVLTAAEIAVWIVLAVLSFALGLISGGLGCVFGLLYPVLMIAILVVHVLCIVKGLKGERFVLPAVSDFADKF